MSWSVLRFVTAAVLAGTVAFSAAVAEPVPTAETGANAGKDPRLETCRPLYEAKGNVRDRLLAFDTVFGKPAIRWTEADYNRVIDLARYCDGLMPRANAVVSGSTWAMIIDDARQKNLPISYLNMQVEKFVETLGSDGIKYPNCWEVLEFRSDPWSFEDNSAALFGLSFMRMTDADLNRAVTFTNQCLVYLPAYAEGAKQWNKPQTIQFLNEVMDKALLVLKRRMDWKAWGPRPTDLVVSVDGVTIPPTLTDTTTREMIRRFNRSAAMQRRLTPETIATLLKMADEVLGKNMSAYDKAYAEAIRDRVQEHIFRRPD